MHTCRTGNQEWQGKNNGKMVKGVNKMEYSRAEILAASPAKCDLLNRV